MLPGVSTTGAHGVILKPVPATVACEMLMVHLTGVGYSFGELLTVDDLNISKVQARRARRKSPGLAVTDKGHLTANGADVTVSSATISSEDFRLGGLSLPFTIPAGHSVPFTITFVPKDRLSSLATLSFASDAKNSPTEQVVTARRVDPVGTRFSCRGRPVLLNTSPDTTYIVALDRVGRTRRSIALWIQAQSIQTCM